MSPTLLGFSVPTSGHSTLIPVCTRVGVWSSIATLGARGFRSEKNWQDRRNCSGCNTSALSRTSSSQPARPRPITIGLSS